MAMKWPRNQWGNEFSYLGPAPTVKINQYMLFDNEVHKVNPVIVHKFNLGDVEDPDLYAGQPLWEWQSSESGKWVMEHSVETPMWQRHVDHSTFFYQYVIVAYLKEKDQTFWALKWGLDK
jgi:hypothetical protein